MGVDLAAVTRVGLASKDRPTILRPFSNPVCTPEGMLFFSGKLPFTPYFSTLSMYASILDMQEGTPRRRSFQFTPVAYWRNFSLLSMRCFFPSFAPTRLLLTCIRCFLGEAKASTPSEPVDLKPPSNDGKPKLKSIVNLLDFEVCEELIDTVRSHGMTTNFYRLPERRPSQLKLLVSLYIVYVSS